MRLEDHLVRSRIAISRVLVGPGAIPIEIEFITRLLDGHLGRLDLAITFGRRRRTEKP